MQQIKWHEPARFIRALKRQMKRGLNRKRQLVLFLAIAGVLSVIFGSAFLVGYFRHGFKEADPLLLWVFPAIVFGTAAAIAYFIPWISSLTNAQIAVSGKGVYRTSRQSAVLVFQHWPWETIKSCRLETVSFATDVFDALTLSLNDGQTISIGLSEKLDVERLEDLLRSAGKLDLRRASTATSSRGSMLPPPLPPLGDD